MKYLIETGSFVQRAGSLQLPALAFFLLISIASVGQSAKYVGNDWYNARGNITVKHSWTEDGRTTFLLLVDADIYDKDSTRIYKFQRKLGTDLVLADYAHNQLSNFRYLGSYTGNKRFVNVKNINNKYYLSLVVEKIDIESTAISAPQPRTNGSIWLIENDRLTHSFSGLELPQYEFIDFYVQEDGNHVIEIQNSFFPSVDVIYHDSSYSLPRYRQFLLFVDKAGELLDTELFEDSAFSISSIGDYTVVHNPDTTAKTYNNLVFPAMTSSLVKNSLYTPDAEVQLQLEFYRIPVYIDRVINTPQYLIIEVALIDSLKIPGAGFIYNPHLDPLNRDLVYIIYDKSGNFVDYIHHSNEDNDYDMNVIVAPDGAFYFANSNKFGEVSINGTQVKGSDPFMQVYYYKDGEASVLYSHPLSPLGEIEPEAIWLQGDTLMVAVNYAFPFLDERGEKVKWGSLDDLAVLSYTSPLSVPEVSTSKSRTSISLYPNPATSQVSFSLPAEQGHTYQLLNFQGKLIQSGSCSDGTNTINTSALYTGGYLLKVTGKDGAVSAGRFIKQ